MGNPRHTSRSETSKRRSRKSGQKSSASQPKAAGRRPGAKNHTPEAQEDAGTTLLRGGNPQIARAEGESPVRAYLAAMPGWKRAIGRQLDEWITRHVPQARKAVKWNSPFYGIGGQGWFLSFHTFTHYVKVSFFAGASLRPIPPGGTSKEARWIDVHEHDLDETQMVAWIRQAALLPGWLTADIRNH